MMNVSWWNIHPFVFTQSLFSFQGTTLWRVLPFRKVVGSSGLEPPTSRLSGVRSNRLSYKPLCKTRNIRYNIFFYSSSSFPIILSFF